MRTGLWLLALGMVCMCSCARVVTEEAEPDGGAVGAAPVVYTVNYPLQYFAQRIAGDAVDVVFPTPPDEDPAFWNPTADDVAAFQQADLIFLNGAGYAKWAARVSLPGAKIVNTCSVQEAAFIATGEDVTHTHGPEGEHAHGGVAFTTWLDGELAQAQAKAVKDALAKKWPGQADRFEAGFQALAQELQGLDQALDEAIPGDTSIRVVFSHPVYQYLARRYGIEGYSVHFEPDKEPSPEMWSALEAMLEKNSATIMIWEGEPLPVVAERLESMGLKSVVFDPAGNVPDSGDYLVVMGANSERLAAAFAE